MLVFFKPHFTVWTYYGTKEQNKMKLQKKCFLSGWVFPAKH
jgi:hypothetical protein